MIFASFTGHIKTCMHLNPSQKSLTFASFAHLVKNLCAGHAQVRHNVFCGLPRTPQNFLREVGGYTPSRAKRGVKAGSSRNFFNFQNLAFLHSAIYLFINGSILRFLRAFESSIE